MKAGLGGKIMRAGLGGMENSIHLVKGIVIFDAHKDGCIYSKYYTNDFRNDSEKQKELDELIDEGGGGVILENKLITVAKRVDKTEGLGISENKDPFLQIIINAKKSFLFW